MSAARRTRRAGGARRARTVDGELLESAFQAQVVGLARFYGWLVFHQPAGGKDGQVDGEQIGPGFPDLLLIRGPELLAVELKPDKIKARAAAKLVGLAGRPGWLQAKDVTDDQAGWLEAFAVVGSALDEAVGVAQGAAGAYLDKGQTTDDAPAVEAHLWRPADWDELEARLSRGRHRVPVAR